MIEILSPIADFFGISPLMLLLITLVFLLLVGIWYVLKFVLKLAWKIMAPGCLLIILIIGGLYLVGVVFV